MVTHFYFCFLSFPVFVIFRIADEVHVYAWFLLSFIAIFKSKSYLLIGRFLVRTCSEWSAPLFSCTIHSSHFQRFRGPCFPTHYAIYAENGGVTAVRGKKLHISLEILRKLNASRNSLYEFDDLQPGEKLIIPALPLVSNSKNYQRDESSPANFR